MFLVTNYRKNLKEKEKEANGLEETKEKTSRRLRKKEVARKETHLVFYT